MNMQAYLEQEIQKVCPLDGISFGKLDDKKTWRIDFAKDATDEQKKLAEAIIENFVWDQQKESDLEKKSRDDNYANQLIYRLAFKEYKEERPEATFSEFIDYLETLKV